MEIHDQSYTRQKEICNELDHFMDTIKDKSIYTKKKKRAFKKYQQKKYDDHLRKSVDTLRSYYDHSVKKKRKYAEKICDQILKKRKIVSILFSYRKKIFFKIPIENFQIIKFFIFP